MKYEEFQQIKNLRPIARDELVLDCDDREFGDDGVRRLGLAFSLDGYRLEVYKAEGQKSFHIHIKDIPHIADLPKEQNKQYKELLIKKYIKVVREYTPVPELDKIDFSLCIPDHLVAEEHKPHFKYGTIKRLIAVVNDGCQNFCDVGIYNLVTQTTSNYTPTIKGSGITAQIIRSISIIDIAKQFGLSVDSRGFAVCPFHPDSNPSLKFYAEQGRFICFGCQEQGNIIKFYTMLKELNPNFVYHKQIEVSQK